MEIVKAITFGIDSFASVLSKRMVENNLEEIIFYSNELTEQ